MQQEDFHKDERWNFGELIYHWRCTGDTRGSCELRD
ncbi:hypothetical protein KSS87_005553, partial [Heliosperma pusillum]